MNAATENDADGHDLGQAGMTDALKAALTRAAARVDQAGDLASEAAALAHAGDTLRAKELALESSRASRETYRLLRDVGAQPLPDMPRPAEVPLHLLDTPQTCTLVEALTAAVAAAEKVDQQRGNVLPPSIPLQPGETRGTGYAETLSNILKRLEIEVYGPSSGRE